MFDRHIEGRGIRDPRVLEAMRSVPRDQFVPSRLADQAYGDHPLPIGHGQTISQPYIVALMSEALRVGPGDRVLEIGTGSGYQTAVLAAIGVEVFTVEAIPELAAAAAERLARLGYEVHSRVGDGYEGWKEHAPFDAIVVTAAPDHLPQPLVDQLVPEGRLVIPIGPAGRTQRLWRITVSNGELQSDDLGAVAFVPFTRPG
jgi:protein-L-isoaspartate(D-aspartate) O-methyltransferase